MESLFESTNFQLFLGYFWRRLPLFILFANAYLVYRLLAVTKLADLFVYRIFGLAARKGSSRPSVLLLYILCSSALLSFIIPNAVVMLTFLPILKRMDFEIQKQCPASSLTTALALAALYGANIGGMGSLIGSPANLMFLGYLDYFQVAGREQVNFISWLFWSLPLVFFFLLLAWGVLCLAIPAELRKHGLYLKLFTDRELTPWQRSGRILFICFILFWTGSSFVREFWPQYAQVESGICLAFFLYFICLAFYRGGPPCQGSSSALLTLRDIFRGVPLRGLAMLCILGLVFFVVDYFELSTQITSAFTLFAGHNITAIFLLFMIILLVIFCTEVFSNTAVAVAFFPVAYEFAQAVHLSPLILMLGVSIASTCAFMTPIATPCNALVVGEMRGIRLSHMLILGAVLNTLGAILMSAWLFWFVPLIW